MGPALVRAVLYASFMPLRRAVLAALALALALGIAPGGAGAQPSQSPLNTPPAAPAQPEPVSGSYRSPGTALALSLGGTLGSLALVSVASTTENDTLGMVGSLGFWLAPSFGHWYAGKGWTKGLSWRLAGGGAATVGLMWFAVDCIPGCGNDDAHPGLLLAIGGGVAFFGGVVHDIATAPGAARAHNARLEGRVHDLAVRPTFGGGRAGVALSGRF